MMKTSVLTTANVPESERFAFWQEALSETFVAVDCRQISRRPFFGEIATTRVNGVSFSRVSGCQYQTVRTPLKVLETRSQSMHVDFQARGTCIITQDCREVTLGPGDLACFDTSRPYVAITSDDFETLVINLPREVWFRRLGPTEQLTARAVRHDSPIGALVSGFLNQAVPVVENAEPTTANNLVEVTLSLITTALGDLMARQEKGQSTGRVSLLGRAKLFIEQNLHDPELSSECIAGALGISLRYLQDLFHKENTTVSNWIWERRLKQCRAHLADPLLAGKSVGQIAFECGFSNFSHFSNRFKAAFSMTPSDFRRQQLGR